MKNVLYDESMPKIISLATSIIWGQILIFTKPHLTANFYST